MIKGHLDLFGGTFGLGSEEKWGIEAGFPPGRTGLDQKSIFEML